MTYESLKKLYYKDEAPDKATYKETYHRRLAEGTVLDFKIGDYPAFFVQNTEVVSLMYEILRQDKKVFSLRENLPVLAAEQYAKTCLIDEIVLSNNIEGVHSSRQEIGEVLERLEDQSVKKSEEKKQRFRGMVNQYVRLMEGETKLPQSPQEIRELYDELVLPEVLSDDKRNQPDGELFRKEQAVIYSPAGKVIHKGLSSESQIRDAMEQALRFLQDDSVEILYRICIFHYLLEYIHPFYDGNGRLGRFLFSCGITKTLEPLLGYRISGIIKENIKEYYDAFSVCNDYRNLGDVTPFLMMMLHMISQAQTDVIESLEEKSKSLKHYGELLEKMLGTNDELEYYLMVFTLFGEKGLSRKSFMRLLNISSTTLKKRLDAVEQRGLLKTTICGKEKYYQLNLEQLDKQCLNL